MTILLTKLAALLSSINSLSGLAILVVSVGLAVAIAYGLYNAFLHPLAAVPGPRLYAASNLPYLAALLAGRWPFVLSKLHDQYGPAVRFTPSDVSFITPQAWQTIYGHKKQGQLSFQKDKRLYRSALTDADNILLADDANHSRHRRLLAHAFSEKALRGQEGVLNHYLALLLSQLSKRADNGEVVNLVQWYNFTTFDIIGDLAFGEPFGCLAAGVYHPWVDTIFDGFKLAVLNQAIKRLPIAAPILRRFIPKQLVKNQMDHLKLSFEKAQKRLETGNTEREDFMSYILRFNDEKGMNPDEIGENANILILAGSETTATLLSGTTFWLLKNPSIYKKLVQEIRTMFAKEEDMTSITIAGAKYLLAVLSEGLRIYPPSPGGLGRVTPKGGAMVDGFQIPEGTVVSVPHWASYHSKHNFVRPDEFIPERWLNDPRFENDVRDVVQPFQFGPRNCLGKNLAYIEMRLILARMLWNFDIELMPDSEHWNEQNILSFWDKGPLNIRLHRVKR
ncbi:hypothetical protein B0A52_01297 [Exophiala mesophila]|uniref:Isotrichodermin C-15 hydroxylase n=1 Tax=Exophiala mesophila TaxID=212818 RepID=A0A438NH19_EXOME|nr:hypothetical protein B0A52_01297 [Exophiala mesophila]